MTARHDTDASFERVEAFSESENPEDVPKLSEISSRLKEAGSTVETCAYQVAGRTRADTVAQLIILAAELERLAERLEH